MIGAGVRAAGSALAGMRAHAEAAWPDEACGLLLGAARSVRWAHPCPNLAPAAGRFAIDPLAYLDAARRARAGGIDVVGVYHSHPGAAVPSAVDLAAARALWPAGCPWVWMILEVAAGSVRGVRAWALHGPEFVEVRSDAGPSD